ncbi:hypothetical protein SJ05684_b52940 (plasmid) [Sinorhizobium sojae CCBAU 05684]|uniref:Uncharacterized protein n=1 Tax=Sinorhizobium sojae CCBAU 05684 TaxID=716928 RepID=A0A249PKF5_9HYPH|nr:hypothetical protein SJ05684_b52940 [Sinorhizobium sojae CCBAU 05684]
MVSCENGLAIVAPRNHGIGCARIVTGCYGLGCQLAAFGLLS